MFTGSLCPGVSVKMGSLPMRVSVWGSLSREGSLSMGVCVHGGLCQGDRPGRNMGPETETPPPPEATGLSVPPVPQTITSFMYYHT